MRLLEVNAKDGYARTGTLRLHRDGKVLPPVETPVLFPVVNLLTGTTPRGGGIWKYTLRRLFAEHSPMMTQALQFLDFSLTGPQLKRWMENPKGSIINQYLHHYTHDLPELGITHFDGPLFLDSGGFKFLGNRRPDLSPFGIEDDADAWRGILAIQKSFGGDMYVSLDYPLKPGLADSEAGELIDRSLYNALNVVEALQENGASHPAFFAPCHGRDYEEMRSSVSGFLQRLRDKGFGANRVGIAIGSLVPLRTVKKFEAMIDIITGARDGISPELQDTVPIHVFGVTGSMIPVLAFLGVDSFDSSSYIHHARTLEYYVPNKHCRVPFLEMETDSLPCDCPHCRRSPAYPEMHSVLVGTDKTGGVKSEVYATLALHNLHWDNVLVTESRAAIRAGSMLEYLVDHARRFPVVRPAIDLLARSSPALRVLLSRQYFAMGLQKRLGDEVSLPDGPIDLTTYSPGPPPWAQTTEPNAAYRPIHNRPPGRISLKYTPDSFRVPSGWRPELHKDVLLVLPCSETKPYRKSHSHQTVISCLAERLASVSRIQKVTLSGLYGPVPAEFEDEEPILGYDFRLAPTDEGQIQLCVRRLGDFLRVHGDCFALKVGYAASRSYRDVMLRVASQIPDFLVLPSTLVKQQLTEMYRKEHLEALASLIEREVTALDRKFTQSITA